MIIKNSVLLLKAQKDDKSNDKYDHLLSTNGMKVTQARTLEFVFKNIGLLREKFKNSDAYEGIIFSSPRCVHAVHLAYKDEDTIIQCWKTKHNFVVGEATHKDALDKLGLECKGKESGNAVNLAHLMLENKNEYSKPFLFPHGNLKTDTLNEELAKESVSIEGVYVYDTIPNSNIEKEIAEITDDFLNVPEYIVFFSPSGVRSSIDFLRRIPDFNSAKLISIGPVTEMAMKQEKLNLFGATKKPTPEALFDLIFSY